MITQKVIDRLFKEQQGHCFNCWRDLNNSGFECHHAIYTRDINFKRWLDKPHNLVLVCPHCHQNSHGTMTSYEGRCKAWRYKKRTGYDMQKWEQSIPLLVHDRFEED